MEISAALSPLLPHTSPIPRRLRRRCRATDSGSRSVSSSPSAPQPSISLRGPWPDRQLALGDRWRRTVMWLEGSWPSCVPSRPASTPLRCAAARVEPALVPPQDVPDDSATLSPSDVAAIDLHRSRCHRPPRTTPRRKPPPLPGLWTRQRPASYAIVRRRFFLADLRRSRDVATRLELKDH